MMKSLIVYSSLTGNTEMVARAIAEELGGDVFSVEDAPDAAGYELVAVGFWVDKGNADAKAAKYIKSLRGKKVALFATLGADPNSAHAAESLSKASALLDWSNTYVGEFICQGKIDPRLIGQMAKMFPADHPHGMNEARKRRHKDAAAHPDAEDLAAARRAFAAIRDAAANESGAET